jgi:hypothetical protein
MIVDPRLSMQSPSKMCVRHALLLGEAADQALGINFIKFPWLASEGFCNWNPL